MPWDAGGAKDDTDETMALVLVAHVRAVGTGAVRGSCRLVPQNCTRINWAKTRMTHGVIDVAWCRSVMAMGSFAVHLPEQLPELLRRTSKTSDFDFGPAGPPGACKSHGPRTRATQPS